MENGAVTVDRAANADTGVMWAMRDLPGGRVLIGATKGLFLAHEVNGAVAVDPTGNADTGGVFAIREFPGGGVLIGAARGLFVAVPLSRAQVDSPRL